MASPIKNLAKFLSPQVLSPVSPSFLSVINRDAGKKYERQTLVAKKIDFSLPNQSNLNNAVTPVKIKITNPSGDFVRGPNKLDFIINTPNKQKIIKNGIEEEKCFNILGRGSFGKVFKAVYKGRSVAMKLLKKSAFIREKVGLDLNHRNIVRTLEIIENGKESFSLIIMEYLPNCVTLQNILENSTINFKELLKYAVDICMGIKYCHSNKILHLDLKPKNILVFNGICKICDFGNSINIFEKMDRFEHHGTIQYTAPEILLGGTPTVKSDVYSLGILFWQLKSRKYPYAEIDNIECIIYQVVKSNLRPELENPKDNFSRLYYKCWNKNCLERPNVSEIIEKLSSINYL